MNKLVVSVSLGLMAWGASAALEPVSPVGGATIPLVPPAQKQVMAVPTLSERLALFAADNQPNKKVLKHDKYWRRSLPVVLQWRATEGEKGPWKVLIGKQPDLTDARTWYISVHHTDKATGRETGDAAAADVIRFEVPIANLEIGAHYYWQVVCRGYCGFGCNPNHGCKACKKLAKSVIVDFRTEDLVPRWIAVEGSVGNMRDLGGRKTLDGRRVKQGMAYRGQGLNDNSVTGEEQGRNRLTMEDVKYLTRTLGIKTDLDLRGPGETADLAESPLGPNVKLIIRSSSAYKSIFDEYGKKVMAANFREFCDPKNYPIYFHCIGGADRTGALAYVLLGLCGVDRDVAVRDWEETFYPWEFAELDPAQEWRRFVEMAAAIDAYGKPDEPFRVKVERYLADCGVTADEIEAIRKIVLE